MHPTKAGGVDRSDGVMEPKEDQMHIPIRRSKLVTSMANRINKSPQSYGNADVKDQFWMYLSFE